MTERDPFLDIADHVSALNSLGFGTLSSPDIRTQIARIMLFHYMTKVAPERLRRLQEACIPLYEILKAVGRRRFPDSHSDFPLLEGRTVTAESVTTWMICVDGWKSLREGAQHCEEAAELACELDRWASEHHLSREWFFDATLRNLSGWAKSEKTNRNLGWSLPASFSIGQDQRSSDAEACQLGRQIAKSLRVPVIPTYNPAFQTRNEHQDTLLRQLAKYHVAQENLFRTLGFVPTIRKRSRIESPWIHMEWFVRYQVLGWTTARIADENGLTAVNEASIYKAINNLAIQLDLELRPRIRAKQPR
jgi:hypothetical protein